MQYSIYDFKLAPEFDFNTYGSCLIATMNNEVHSVLLGQDKDFCIDQFYLNQPPEYKGKKTFISTSPLAEKVLAVINNNISSKNIPLFLSGTVFQKKVYQALRDIPMGETRSYKDIAQIIGSPK